MSSYLSIYVVPKRKFPEESKQHIILASYSRCTEMYQQFYNNINPAYVGNGEDKYTTIGKNEISEVLDSFDGKIRRMTATLTTNLRECPRLQTWDESRKISFCSQLHILLHIPHIFSIFSV